MAEPIVITGAGIVSALGIGRAATLDALRQGRTGISPAPRHLHTLLRDYPVGEVPLSNDELRQRLGISAYQPTNRTALLGIMAVEEALQQAHLLPLTSSLLHLSSYFLPFINGTTVGGMDLTEDYYDEYIAGGPNACYAAIHDCGSTTELIARHFGLCFSWSTTVSTACSSAMNAIISGCNLIRSGQTEVAVVGGSECLTRFHLNGFRSLMVLDHDVTRPFSDDRAGLNLGEGAAYLVIETLSSAQRRHATPLGYILGYGNACDAFHQTRTSDNGEGPCLAMQKALNMACLKPADISAVHAHGTGTPNNDATELTALQRVFGHDSLPELHTTKRLTGHTTSAAGSVGAVIALLDLQQGSTVMVNAFGFGGNDSSLIISHDPHESHWPHEPHKSPIFVKGDASIADGGDPDYRQWLSPLESRRMGKLLKRAIVTAEQAMMCSGIGCPDAIISATRYGCIDNTEKFLRQLQTAGEEQPLSPTSFMQSTHNTIASLIAERYHCHGYNTTYSHGSHSAEAAIDDAVTQLRLGDITSALVIINDELTPTWADVLRHAGVKPPLAASRALLLSTDPTNALYTLNR